MAYNIALKVAIIQSKKFQAGIAKQAGLQPSVLSLIIHGRLIPSDDEKKAIAKVLKRPVHELFPSVPDEAKTA